MWAPPLACCAGCGAVRVAVRRCRLREDPSGGPLDALRRRGTRLRLVAARHGTGLVTVDGARSTVTSGRGAPASATMIAPAASHDPAAARVVAAARPGRSGGLPGPLRRERGEWTSPRVDAIHGVNDDSNPPDVAGAGKGST